PLRSSASVVAVVFAVGAAAMVLARTGKAASTAAGTGTAAKAPGGSSTNGTGSLSRLFPVTPDGNGSSYGTYSAAATVASTSSSWVNKYYSRQAAARQTSGVPASYYWAVLIGSNDYC